MAKNRKAIPPINAPITLRRGVLPLLEDDTDVANDEANNVVDGTRSGLVKLVASDVTDGEEWNDTDSVEVKTDGAYDVIKLDDKDPKVEVVAEGLPMVAAPSSKRADGVLQHLVFSKVDSQQ